MLRKAATLICVVLAFVPAVTARESASELFEKTIRPISRSHDRSSCVQCHLAAVDLKDYILPSNEKTFASLRDQGLIDLDSPEKSKILTFIRKGGDDADKDARLAHEKTRRGEEKAFAAWINACCEDATLRKTAKLNPDNYAKPKRPEAVIKHALKSRVVDSFTRNVWSYRMRCLPYTARVR
ncbi:MAG: hypothetical protein ABGZ35_23490 [Planctomycetaceae bacterium]